MDYVEEINKLVFDKTDPFEIGKFYFDSLESALTPQEFSMFAESCYKFYFDFMQERELFASFLYKQVEKHIPKQEYKLYFKQMQQEEREHADFFTALNNKIYGSSRVVNESEMDTASIQMIDPEYIIDVLINAYIAECKFVATLTLWYKQSKSAQKKKLLNYLLADEARHINEISDMIADMFSSAHDKQRLLDKFLEIVRKEQFLVKPVVESFFKERPELIDKTYQSEFHVLLVKRLLQSTYKCFSKLDDSVTYESFVERIG